MTTNNSAVCRICRELLIGPDGPDRDTAARKTFDLITRHMMARHQLEFGQVMPIFAAFQSWLTSHFCSDPSTEGAPAAPAWIEGRDQIRDHCAALLANSNPLPLSAPGQNGSGVVIT